MITDRQRSRRRASFCGEPLYSGIGGVIVPRHVPHLPLRALGQLVVAEDARELALCARRRCSSPRLTPSACGTARTRGFKRQQRLTSATVATVMDGRRSRNGSRRGQGRGRRARRPRARDGSRRRRRGLADLHPPQARGGAGGRDPGDGRASAGGDDAGRAARADRQAERRHASTACSCSCRSPISSTRRRSSARSIRRRTSMACIRSSGPAVPRAADARAATPVGIMALLAAYDIELTGANAVVVGRSDIVGKPVAHLLLQHTPP